MGSDKVKVVILAEKPPGPLDVYRKKATFSWKAMRLLLDGEELIKHQEQIWTTLANDPLFQPSITPLPLPQLRELVYRRMKRLSEYKFMIHDELCDFVKASASELALRAMCRDGSFFKYRLNLVLVGDALKRSNRKEHHEMFGRCSRLELFGAFCLTEVGHGSNTKGMRTTATYDPSSQEFILNTPNFEAAKCWCGNLGQSANIAVVYAQLHTADGKHHGLHGFVVPIRDTKTHLPFPGIVVGDMGAKCGMDGVDNGFMMFHHYRVRKESLINITGDIAPNGTFIPLVKDPSKRFSTTMGALGTGRVSITRRSCEKMIAALTIAIRYSAVRKQFGPTKGEELPVLEYQMQQWRLLPYLSASYALHVFQTKLSKIEFNNNRDIERGEVTEKQEGITKEMHTIASASKPWASWTAMRCIQECREACGGHGYLWVSGLGDLRNYCDPLLTFEGDNNVLQQQTGNKLLNAAAHVEKGEKISSPIGSMKFINNMKSILQSQFVPITEDEILDPRVSIFAYEWLVCYLLKQSSTKMKRLLNSGMDRFTARNNCQVYHLRSLSMAFIELTILREFYNFNRNPSIPRECFTVLKQLCSLFGLWSIEKHMDVFYEGGYFNGSGPSRLVKNTILSLCSSISDNAVSLMDVLALPDVVLNSPLGCDDGKVYERLHRALLQTPGCLERPYWWKEVVQKPSIGSLAIAKL